MILFIWLIVGALAAGQRGYFSLNNVGCSQGATMAVTILAYLWLQRRAARWQR